MFNTISKFIYALMTAVGVTTITAVTAGPLSVPTLVAATVSLLTAASVYQFPNGEYGFQKVLKAVVALSGAIGLGVTISIFEGTVTTEAIVASIFALFGALSIYGVENKEVTEYESIIKFGNEL